MANGLLTRHEQLKVQRNARSERKPKEKDQYEETFNRRGSDDSDFGRRIG